MSIGGATTGTWMHMGGFCWRSSQVKQGSSSFVTAAEALLWPWRNGLSGRDEESAAEQNRGMVLLHDTICSQQESSVIGGGGLLHGSFCGTRLFSVRPWCGLVTKCWANPRFPKTAEQPRLALVLLRLYGGNGRRAGCDGVDYVV